MIYDLFPAGVGLDFVDEVGVALTPGKAALIADVDEMWVTPVDSRLGALDAITFRTIPADVVDAELIRAAESARTELELVRTELQESSGAAKANVKSAIETQRRKLEALDNRIAKTIHHRRAEFGGAARHAARAAGQGA